MTRALIASFGSFLLLSATTTSAQFGDLLDKVKKKAEDTVESRAEQKTEETANSAIDEATAGKAAPPARRSPKQPPSGAEASSQKAAETTGAADQMRPGQGAWANYDFKPGTRVLFAEDFRKDEVGDFPKRLEFVSGAMELVEWQGGRWLRLSSTSKFSVPLPEVLPARYTMEFDFSVPGGEMWIYPDQKTASEKYIVFGNGGVGGVNGGEVQARSNSIEGLVNKVAHARVMADGAYIKVYVNDKRCVNVPNFTAARSNKIHFWTDAHETDPAMFGNFRIAAGGKKLYDALAQDGHVATQGIYFDTGSDRVRPESTPTLKEIAGLLTEHPGLKLRIEGHTDNVGAPAANLALSQKRAAAVRQALVDQFGADGSRLTTQGLGATKPLAPNDTPEGRQNNRRVELVKI